MNLTKGTYVPQDRKWPSEHNELCQLVHSISSSSLTWNLLFVLLTAMEENDNEVTNFFLLLLQPMLASMMICILTVKI